MMIGLHVFNLHTNVLFSVKSTAGPMASSVSGLIAATRVFASEQMFEEDPTIPWQPFNEKVCFYQYPEMYLSRVYIYS